MKKQELVDLILEKLINHDSYTLGCLVAFIDEFINDRFSLTLLVRYLEDPKTYKSALKDKISKIQDLDNFPISISDWWSDDTPDEIQMDVEKFIEEIPIEKIINDNELLMALLDAFEKDPISYEKPMIKQLELLKVHEDKEVLNFARQVLSNSNTEKSINVTGGTVTGYIQNQSGNLTQTFK